MYFILGKPDDQASDESGVQIPSSRKVVERLEVLLCLCVGRPDHEWRELMAHGNPSFAMLRDSGGCRPERPDGIVFCFEIIVDEVQKIGLCKR